MSPSAGSALKNGRRAVVPPGPGIGWFGLKAVPQPPAEVADIRHFEQRLIGLNLLLYRQIELLRNDACLKYRGYDDHTRWTAGICEQFNLTVEQEVSPIQALFKMAYVGNLGRRLGNGFNPNQPIPGPGGTTARRPFFQRAPRTGRH